MLGGLLFRLRALFRRGEMERELDDELRFHLEQATEAYVAQGHSRDEAARRARLDLDGVEKVKEDCRDERGTRLLEDLASDVKYGVRVLRRSPAFTVIAVMTLALGIGANTAMFSIANAVLRHPLPYDEPSQLVRMHANKPGYGRGSISYPNFKDWRDQNRSFAGMAVSRGGAFTLTGAGVPERVSADLVSSDYFTVLGVEPLLGRAFAKGEAEPGGPAVALLGEKLWKSKFGAARDVVGKSVLLDGNSFTVIGVMPASPDLRAVSGGTARDIYAPIGQFATRPLQSRAAGLGIHGVGRLAPGVSLEQARADLAAVNQRLAEQYPDTNKSVGATIYPLREAVVGQVRPYVLILFGAVGLVLLIACVNVANLLLARSAGRARELGIRLALGASRGRLIRQLLTESLLLAVAGGALGVLVAWWCASTLFGLVPRGLPQIGTPGIDGGMLAFAAIISIVAGVLSGLTPALKAARPDLHDTLKEGGRGPSSTRYRTQTVFVILQMAMAFVLLAGAGLLVRTLLHLSNANPGFEKADVVTFGIALAPSLREAEPAHIRAELRRIDAALAAAPGVASATLAYGGVPLEADDQLQFVRAEIGEAERQQHLAWAQRFTVGVDYLSTMRIRLVRGRFFTAHDDERAPRVVVIDDVFARMHFPNEDPVGKRIRINNYGFEPVEIIGVVAHTKQWGLDQDETTATRAQIYEAFLQLHDVIIPDAPNGIIALVRAPGDVIPNLRGIIASLGAENVMYRVRTADEIITSYQGTRRFAVYVLAAFAVLALVLSCVGIYGVVSYIVAQRTQEIGIRMALGARAADILKLVLRQGTKLVVVGIALGLAGATAASPFTEKLIYGVPAIDPFTFAIVAFAISSVALAAIVLPARRAMRMDPVQALRAD